MRKSLKKSFTILELLIVIAIITIMAAMLLPALKKSRNTARAIICGSNLKQIGVAELSYANDSNGWSTPANSLFHSASSVPVWHQILSNSLYLSVSQVGKSSVIVCPGNPPYVYNGLQFTYAVLGKNNFQPYRISTGDVIGALDKKLYSKASKFILSVDSVYDNTASTYNLNQYYFFTTSTGEFGKIGARHNAYANTVFADGHANAMKAQDLIGLTGVIYDNIYIKK